MPLKPMYPANNPVTVQLAQNLSSADALIPVTDVSLFPAPPNFVTIGTEQNAETILYTGLDLEGGRLIGCQRGRFGTLPADWPAGEFIYHAWSPDNANILMENILTLAEEKASVQEVLRLDDALEGLEGSLQSLNEGKANATAVEEVVQSLEGLTLRLDGVEAQKADASHITRIDAAIAGLESALAELGGEGELDPSDIARLEAAIVAVNQALAAKADTSQITRIDEELADLSAALEGKASADALAAKADVSQITRIDGELADLSAALGGKADTSQITHIDEELADLSIALEGKASADALAAKADVSQITRIDEELADLSTALEGKASADALAAKADASQITRIDEELADLSTALEGKASADALAAKADTVQVEALTRRAYSVFLTATGWSPSGDLFRHSLSLPVREGDQADFSAAMPVLYQLAQDGILVHFENDSGVLSAVASGQPDFDFSAQATLYKVVSGA